MHPNTIDITGKIFGRIKVIGPTNKRANGRDVYWLCECSCGKQKEIIGYSIRSGNTQSCGCLRLERVTKKNGESIINRLYKYYTDSAKKRNIDWEITKKKFVDIITKECSYCDSKPERKTINGLSGFLFCNGVDRIDSSLGYSNDNCVTACSMCNQMKWTYNTEEFLNHIEKIYFHNEQKRT